MACGHGFSTLVLASGDGRGLPRKGLDPPRRRHPLQAVIGRPLQAVCASADFEGVTGSFP